MLLEEIINQCTVEGNVVKLPNVQLERNTYLQVAKTLNLIGGKWKGGKVSGFVFPENPEPLLLDIQQGVKRNLKKEYQLFYTPELLAHRVVELADIEKDHTVLEPSAGMAALVNAVNSVFPDKIIDCYEIVEFNRAFLKRIPTVNLLGDDFLEADEEVKYDRILINPPFTKNQDIAHIKKAFKKLNTCGKIVSITSRHWLHSQTKKCEDFRTWLDHLGAEVHYVEWGAFKESGTNIATLILVITKPSPLL